MKVRESGMPEEELWTSFFDPDVVLKEIGIAETIRDLVEFGCGYGTFTIPAAQVIGGTVHALDVEPEMIVESKRKAKAAGLTNIHFHLRDFVVGGTGLPDASVDYVMMFNILHTDQPLLLLREARRVLAQGGRIGIIHWNHDPATPRGPSLDIRPKPEQCRRWAAKVGFYLVNPHVDFPPYHYGIIVSKIETGKRNDDRIIEST